VVASCFSVCNLEFPNPHSMCVGRNATLMDAAWAKRTRGCGLVCSQTASATEYIHVQAPGMLILRIVIYMKEPDGLQSAQAKVKRHPQHAVCSGVLMQTRQLFRFQLPYRHMGSYDGVRQGSSNGKQISRQLCNRRHVPSQTADENHKHILAACHHFERQRRSCLRRRTLLSVMCS
jgi:hypothetical protein